MTPAQLEIYATSLEQKIEMAIFEASTYALRNVGNEGVLELKEGLNQFRGKPGSKNYESSAPGQMPYKHSGKLHDSIGMRTLISPQGGYVEVGANVNSSQEAGYARYLEGDGYGIRPFLWFMKDMFNFNRFEEHFFKRLKEAKQKI